MNEPTKEQIEAMTIYMRLSKEKKLDTIDPATKILALQYRAYKRANRTQEQKDNKLKKDADYYYENHCERLEYFQNRRNTEEHKQYMKEFRKSEAGVKSARITKIKQLGIVSNDYDALYEKWKSTTHCEDCKIELKGTANSATRKCIDHKTGVFRAIVCYKCSIKEKN